MLVCFLHQYIFCVVLWLTLANQDMSGIHFLSRPEILCSMLTDVLADTQGQVGLPSDVVLQRQAFTHLFFFFLDVMKLDLNAQYVRHAAKPFAIDSLKHFV